MDSNVERRAGKVEIVKAPLVIKRPLTRRQACRFMLAGVATLGCRTLTFSAEQARATNPFRLRYILASSLYGDLPLETILSEMPRAGTKFLDLWPRPHGTQREQVEAMGHERFAALLERHEVRLGAITRYDLGPFGLQQEMGFAKRFDARLIITGSRGPKQAEGSALKTAVKDFVEQMKPHLDAAAEANVIIGIENHGHALIQSPDSMRYLAELDRSGRLGIALAPYHLPQEGEQIAGLIKDLGPKLVHFYAWQHGQGAMQKLPKEEEMRQLPGRGPLDFRPILRALEHIHYPGWTSIFMHPFPRGIPILPTAKQVTDTLNESRDYLDRMLTQR